MRKTFIKKICTSVLACALIIGTVSGSAFAASRDFYNTSTKKVYTSIATMSTDDFNAFVNDVANNEDNYVYEFNGKYYSYTNLVNDYFKNYGQGLGVMQSFANCTANTANIQTGFDPSAYTAAGSSTTSDFSVISIE